MRDIFDQTLGVFNDEVDSVDTNFTAFIADLKAELNFNTIVGNVGLFSELVTNYTNDIQPSMADALLTVTNIRSLLNDIQNSCQANLCDDFIAEVNDGLLADGIFNISLPDLPPDIGTNLQELSKVLNDVDEGISNVNISVQLVSLKDQINGIGAEFDNVLTDLEVTQAEFFRRTVEIPAMISDNFKYIHIAVLALGAVLSVLLALVLLGVTCGSYTRQGTSTARTASTTICWSFSVFSILAALLFILCAALLLVGGICGGNANVVPDMAHNTTAVPIAANWWCVAPSPRLPHGQRRA